MNILKFGGTSLGTPERMKSLLKLIKSQSGDSANLVVLSAVAGTTNALVLLNQLWSTNDEQKINHYLGLKKVYDEYIKELLNQSYWPSGQAIIESHFNNLLTLINRGHTIEKEKEVLAFGELISTSLFHLYCQQEKYSSSLINALDFMTKDRHGEPDLLLTKSKLLPFLTNDDNSLIITQGYICRNHVGHVDNLERGGSDYTATILGNVLQANEVQIWTDIDGMHNNDPRIVPNTQPVRTLSYREASELAYFGAKILHPSCIVPARSADVPVWLKYTFDPDAQGTLISDQGSGRKVTAIAAKDGITAIKIRSGRMLHAYGFLRKVFEVFERYKTSIDMITTSEVSVSLTIDDDAHLENIIEDLRPYGEISFERQMSIICVVGDRLSQDTRAVSQVTMAISEVPVRMISYGGSLNNISFLVESTYKVEALKSLHAGLFEGEMVGV